MIRIVLLLALLGLNLEAAAHTRSTSYGHWQMAGPAVSLDLRVAALDLSRFGAGFATPEQAASGAVGQLKDRFQVDTPAGPCTPQTATPATARADGWIHLELRWQCPQARPLRISALPFHDVAPSHAHIARISRDTDRDQTAVLTRRNPSTTVAADAVQSGFFSLGIAHILSGWDHLAFVAALALAAGRMLTLIALLSGFTIAHSLTLAAASLGWVVARELWVETMIAYSILLVAAQWLWQRSDSAWIWATLISLLPLVLLIRGTDQLTGMLGLILMAACLAGLGRRPRPGLMIIVTMAFGLLHGLGFAGALAEAAGPQGITLTALLLFNLGVEAGQIGVVILLWPVLVYAPALRLPLAAGLVTVGLYWFLERGLLA